MMRTGVGLVLASVVATALPVAAANALTLTKLTGLTGGTIQGTAVYRADLSSAGIGQLGSVTIVDNSGMLGGATGQFSGFDLDAVVISNTLCATAACAQTASNDAPFSSTIFTPGTQRPPVDPKLFGTDAAGTAVDNSVATLGLFDGESTTAIPGADGFLSMGDNGSISLNLAAILSIGTGPGPYIYFGEVGDNGEVAAANITLSPNPVPLPAALPLFASALVGLGAVAQRKRRVS